MYTKSASMLTLILLLGFAAPAQAEGFNNNAWGFSPQNRASIASLMKQVEGGSSGVSGTSSGGSTTLICGDGASTAKGNASCIILNNSTGNIEIGQDSQGNQTASSETQTTTNVTEHMQVENTIATDDILATLHGGDKSSD